MSDSLTTKAMKRISAECHAALKLLGFRRRAPHLFRECNDLFHGIHFQGTPWDMRGEEGQFTINLVVTSESLYSFWTDRKFPTNPATALWPVQERLGELCPEHKDLWWKVSTETDVSALSAEICRRLQTYGLPFFDDFSSKSAMLDNIQRRGMLPGTIPVQLPLLQAMLLTEAGRREEATTCLEVALAEHGTEGFGCTVLAVAKTLDLLPDIATRASRESANRDH